MLNKLHPRVYNALALFLTCAVGSILGAVVNHFSGNLNLSFIVASFIGYGFGRFFMPLK
ncbi:MAG: hypothetical protein HYV90_05365 [Candidatus Woesebacteria bacterium]|nr:MAG: hypothetical protein HYV90_05365 [Candidatus Woesebacteria bacterium]